MTKTPEAPAGGAAAAHELDALPIAGFKGTPEEIERQWYEQVYLGRGDSQKQLTLRAVLMGSLLGGVLSLTNLYIGLKAGWGFGVAIAAIPPTTNSCSAACSCTRAKPSASRRPNCTCARIGRVRSR